MISFSWLALTEEHPFGTIVVTVKLSVPLFIHNPSHFILLSVFRILWFTITSILSLPFAIFFKTKWAWAFVPFRLIRSNSFVCIFWFILLTSK